MSYDSPKGAHADTLVIPERRFSEEKKEDENTHEEYLQKLDAEIKTADKKAKRHRYTFILKYIGAWYITLSIFKGLYLTFSPTFDIIGLVLFLTGFIWERINAHKAKKEIQERWADRDIVIGKGSI